MRSIDRVPTVLAMTCLAYAAHELRTPLATQRALLELALADPGTDAATWREIGEDVLGACREQERLLDTCLALAHGSLQRREPVDLATIAGETLRSQNRCSLTTEIGRASCRERV